MLLCLTAPVLRIARQEFCTLLFPGLQRAPAMDGGGWGVARHASLPGSEQYGVCVYGGEVCVGVYLPAKRPPRTIVGDE